MKRLFFVLITHIVATQTLFAQLEIETTVPTGFDEAINVGVGTGHFETIVKNKSGVETITGIKVTPLGGLDGLEILANATYEYNGTVYSASVTGDLIQTVGSLRLMAGEQIKFIYEKRAKCSIVPQASSGYSMQVVDDISVLGTDYSEQTNSYPVLFPGLSVIVPESPYNNVDVEYREEYTDTVTIRNEANAGRVNHLILQIERAKDVLAVYNVEVTYNGQSISFPFTSLQDIRIELNSSDLEQLGFQDGIMPSNSQFQMIVSGRVEKYAATTQVRYTADYKTFGISCNRLRNAEGVKYFQQKYPNPQLLITSNIISTGNYCDKKLVAEFTIENTSTSNPSNYLLNMYINTKRTTNFVIESMSCNGVSLQAINGIYYLNVLEDLNQNGNNTDYDGKNPITLTVVAIPSYAPRIFQHRLLLDIVGTKINGETYTKFAGGTQQSEKKHSYVTGDATIDSELKKFGMFTFEYYADIFEGERLIDYSIHIKGPDSLINISGQRNGFSMIYEGDYQDSVKACTHGNILYQLQLKTEGCEDKIVILTEASPTIVQRCHGSGGGCYEGNVTEASFDRKEINTCDEVSLQAKGNIAYSCNSDCPKFKSVAVSIEDIKGVLPIEISNPLLEGIPPAQTLEYRDGMKAYEFLIPLEECTDEVPIVRKELTFSGNLFVNDHINVNRVDANIQVRYILVESDSNGENILHDDTWTWGDMLTVYDPKPILHTYTPLENCSSGRVEAKLSEGAKTGTPARILITEVELPAQPDFYYEPNGIYATGMPYTISNLQWEISQEQEKSWSVEGLKPKCAEDGKANSLKYGVIQYEDFYGTSCQRTVRKDDVYGIAEEPYEMPKITLHPTERQQSVESTTTWTLLVENNGHSTAQHVMLRLTPNEENSMTIKIDEVRLNGQICSNLKRFGNSVYVPIEGSFAKSTQKVVTVTAKYEDCTEDGISTIDVESAWSCEELSKDNFDDFNCGGTAVLELENMVAVLNAVETYPKEYFHFCEDIPIHVNISNIGRADLNQLGFWFDSLPNIYNITNDELVWNNDGQTNEITGITSSSVSNSLLSQYALKSNDGVLKGISSLDIDFNLQMHCDGEENRIGILKFSIAGYTNCQAKQIKNFQFKPKLKEFQYLDSLSVQATVDDNNFEYGGVRNFTATVQNLSNALVDSAYITITIPNNLQYIGYDARRSIGVVDEEIIANNNGTTTVEWKLQEGIHLAPQEQITVYYQLQAKQLCGQSLEVLTQGTLLRKMRDCDGTECDFKNSTDAVVLTVNTPQPQFSATISQVESTCKGNYETYIVSGVGIESIEWTISPETIGTLTSNGQTANMHYTGKGVATISANVVGSCETLHLNAQTTVLDKPNFSITPPDSILWKDWNELGVRAVSTEYAESNWTVPQIDTCGQYTLTYEETNECGSVRESIPIKIYRCCEPEKVNMPDTLHISYSDWEKFTLDSIKVTPENGKWDTLKIEPHGMCGEYKYKYTVTKCDSTATDSIVIIVEDCCTKDPYGDLVETERAGVTTYDVEVLRQYVKDNNSLIQDTELYETYKIKMRDCDTYKYVPLVPCFKKWADINEDGKIDNIDVELLMQMVK